MHPHSASREDKMAAGRGAVGEERAPGCACEAGSVKLTVNYVLYESPLVNRSGVHEQRQAPTQQRPAAYKQRPALARALTAPGTRKGAASACNTELDTQNNRFRCLPAMTGKPMRARDPAEPNHPSRAPCGCAPTTFENNPSTWMRCNKRCTG